LATHHYGDEIVSVRSQGQLGGFPSAQHSGFDEVGPIPPVGHGFAIVNRK
jgi:hypothetical protein